MDDSEGVDRVGVGVQDHRLIAEKAVENCAIQKPRELAEFLSLLVDVDVQVIVEIGVHMGGTLGAWRQVVPVVIGIDDAYPRKDWDSRDWGATVITGDSHDATTVVALEQCLDGRPIDCLFIDGDHTCDGVRQDYEMYGPLVRPGGLIAFHDIAPIADGQSNVDGIQVKRFWDEIKDESAVEIVDTEDHLRSHIGGYGIGVLRK